MAVAVAAPGGCSRPIPPQNAWCPYSKAETHPTVTFPLLQQPQPMCRNITPNLTSLQPSQALAAACTQVVGFPISRKSCGWGLQEPIEEQSQERIFLVSGPLNADCVHIALEVFLCPSRLPVEVCLLERTFFFCSIEKLRRGQGLIYHCLS